MGKIKGVHHIALKPCSAIYKKVEDFYRNILGFEEIRSWGEGDTYACMLSCGDNTVMEILHGEDDGSLKTGALNHIAFATDDVDEIIEKVREAGYEITIEPKEIPITPEYPVRIAFFIGPVGETIELFREL